ncbi:TIGR03773 family transporter-associated surface protein [Actinophytocola gossypii]|uniref:TIGR03773 family transporter-associated surface protein n=1 Tax=Actinophytocola gossypii TaxID=2812003 RepID=A0ABT2JCH7_9PSEU|nr:TIGR03773 family transporter-associated surface protein [Actinophytocola gossypii]MCT2585568.1 TIGR03773 family transporter-associated surface protein [Actinophytocola gossypii]
MRRALPTAALLAVSLLAPAAAHAQPPDQTIDADQPVATERAVLSRGHVDLGPRYVDGDWTLMVHDDSADPSVWRSLDRTVFEVSDQAVLPVPEDPAYSFIGEPGTPVYVVPQVQNPDVAWVGWNTQDPEVLDTIDGGVTLTLTGVDGPGELFVYLQAGNFGAADVLWDSGRAERQDIWVEVNTHTHANWVFTEPGVYLVQVEVAADLVDGRTVGDPATIRFAIGDATDTEAAFAAEPPAATSAPAEAAVVEDAGDSDSGTPVVALGIGAVALALVVGAVIVVVRGRAAKRRARTGGAE